MVKTKDLSILKNLEKEVNIYIWFLKELRLVKYESGNKSDYRENVAMKIKARSHELRPASMVKSLDKFVGKGFFVSKHKLRIFGKDYGVLSDMRDKLKRDFKNNWGLIGPYDSEYIELGELLEKIKARIRGEIKEVTISEDKWVRARRASMKKEIDIMKPGLLCHVIMPKTWNSEEVVAFAKNGIMCPKAIGQDNGVGYMRDRMSFYMSASQVIYDSGMVTFILDPEYVKRNAKSFGFITDGGNSLYNKECEKVCGGLGMKRILVPKFYDKYSEGEVVGPKEIEFSAIVGVVVGNKYRDRVVRLMNELVDYNPDIVFPVYDVNGRKIWPS